MNDSFLKSSPSGASSTSVDQYSELEQCLTDADTDYTLTVRPASPVLSEVKHQAPINQASRSAMNLLIPPRVSGEEDDDSSLSPCSIDLRERSNSEVVGVRKGSQM